MKKKERGHLGGQTKICHDLARSQRADNFDQNNPKILKGASTKLVKSFEDLSRSPCSDQTKQNIYVDLYSKNKGRKLGYIIHFECS